MKHLLWTILLVAVCLGIGAIAAVAQDAARGVAADTVIPRNSRFYIEPMDGFETYLAAAIRKKEVPIVIVTEPDMADFVISGTHDVKSAGWAKTIFLRDVHPSASASMQVTNTKTHVVVYADSSNRSSANRGEASTAEKLAKYLRKKIENDEKALNPSKK
jgi:hypothetical protein